MGPNILLAALGLLLLSCLSSVSPATEHLASHLRNVRATKSLGGKLKTSKFVTPDIIRGLRGKTLALGHQQRASSKVFPPAPDIRDWTNNIKDGMSRTSRDRRLKTISQPESLSSKHNCLMIETILLLNGAKRKRKRLHVSKTENHKGTDSKFLAAIKYRSRFNPKVPNNTPITVSHYSKVRREKRAPKWYIVQRSVKNRQHIFPADGFKNPTHGNSTLYNVDAADDKSSHNGKAMSPLFKDSNSADLDKTYQMTSPAFQIHDIIQSSDSQNREIPNVLEERHIEDGDIDLPETARTFYLQNEKSIDVSEHNHKTFQCGKCTCLYTTKDKLIAKCTDDLLRFPDDLPTDTWQLILFGNHITWLNMTHLIKYSSLSKLQISNNTRLAFIEKSVEDVTTLLKELDLSENNINSIDDKSFEIMPHLLTLNLAFNNIKAITNLTFAGLDQLRNLNLSKNIIVDIAPTAFYNLTQLKTLDLSRNLHNMHGCERAFSPQLMKPLKKLKYLLLLDSLFDCKEYPNRSLQQLTNLQRLSMNGIYGAQFGPEISTLKHLTHLDLGSHYGSCHITEITDVFFQNLPYLDTLILTDCNKLKKIESTIPDKPLSKTLRHLRIVYSVGYDLTTALSDLKAFQNSSLQTLAFVALYHSDGHFPCRFLRKDDVLYLKNLQLEELDLSKNRLSLLDNDFLSELPKTLKRLILTDNRFTSDGLTLKRLSSLTELVELDTSYQNMDTYFFSQQYMHECQKNSEYSPVGNTCKAQQSKIKQKNQVQSSLQLKYADLHGIFKSTQWEQEAKKNCSCSFYSVPKGNNTTSNLQSNQRTQDISGHKISMSPYPPKLQIIRASYHNSFGMRALFRAGERENAFKEVYFSNSFLTKLNLGSLSPSIQIADLSNNYCDSIGTSFFQPNNSLVKLSLQGNLLGEEFASDINGSIFAWLNNTKYLDIQYNIIFNLPENFFRGLRLLETLKLSNNKLQVLDTKFSHLTSLQSLTLRKNSISWISRDTRNDLDILATSHPLQVDLTMNPLPCTCEGLELINWMAMTNVRFKHKTELRCRLEDGKTVEFGNLQERSRSLQQYCASKPLIIVICVASICVMAILVGFSVLYRYRWKLRYLRHIVLKRMVGFKPLQNQGPGYKFDAYILYTEKSQRFVHVDFLQELETKRGHRLCISERDFLPGTYNISNIVSAIQNSAKTVVVVTPELYEDEYSEYGIKMAIMEELYKNRNVLHLCVYQPMPPDDMAKYHDLLMVMKRNHYTEYPPDEQATEEILQDFWDQQSLAIGHEHDPQVPAQLELQ